MSVHAFVFMVKTKKYIKFLMICLEATQFFPIFAIA